MPTTPDTGAGRTLHQMSNSPRVQSWITAMTEALDLPLLLVDDTARLLNANHLGERELRRSRLLSLRDNHVRAARAGDERSFNAALAAAARTGRRRRWRGGAVLVSPLERDGAGEGEPRLLMLALHPA